MLEANLDELRGQTFDLVCTFEVLEHIEDDAAITWRWAAICCSAFPAHSKRFAESDVAVGHLRRYDRQPLRRADGGASSGKRLVVGGIAPVSRLFPDVSGLTVRRLFSGGANLALAEVRVVRWQTAVEGSFEEASMGIRYRATQTFAALSVALGISLTSAEAAATEYDDLRTKWVEVLTGGPSFDPTSYATKLASLNAEAQAHWDAMAKPASPPESLPDDDRIYLWDDLYPLNAGTVRFSFDRLLVMALANTTNGCALEDNAQLKGHILNAIAWLHYKFYKVGQTATGWWDNEIGTPLALTKLLALHHAHIGQAERTAYLAAIRYFVLEHEHERSDSEWVNATAANRVWQSTVAAQYGLLAASTSVLAQGRDGLIPVFGYIDGTAEVDGFYRDGGFVQHGEYAYNGGYGRALIVETLSLVHLLNGSAWAVSDGGLANVYRWLYDSYEPFMYKGALMDSVRGREISRSWNQDHIAGQGVIGAFIMASEMAPPGDATYFKKVAKGLLIDGTHEDYFSAPNDKYQNIRQLVKAHEILGDANIVERAPLIGHYTIPSIARAVHRTPNWGFAVSMFSDTIANYESIDVQNKWENMKGWYTGSGMTQLYTSDQAQFSEDFWPTVNSRMLPGVTEEVDFYPDPDKKNLYNEVGGCNIADRYGVAGMHLHTPCGAGCTTRVRGYKSWFMFDDEVVCLGSGITSTSGAEVQTVIENRKLNGSGTNAFSADGVAQLTGAPAPNPTAGGTPISSVDYMHLAGAGVDDIGYYLPTTATIMGAREARIQSWDDINERNTNTTDVTRNYLKLYFNHGTSPSNKKYDYVILPGFSASAVSGYATSPDVRIVENSTDVHAVKEETIGITAANFWTNNTKTAGIITANRKASIMVREHFGELEVAISDITRSSTTPITVTIAKGAAELISSDSELSIGWNSQQIALVANVNGSKGKTLRAKFRADDLVSRWDFDESSGTTVTDSIGNNDGIIVSGSRLGQAFLNGGLTFDDSGDYVNVGQPSSLNFTPGTHQFSVSCWFRLAQGKDGAFVSKATEGGVTKHQFQLGYSQANDSVFVTVGSVRTDLSVPFDDGAWHHVVAAVQTSGVDLYVDNQLRAKGASIGSYVNSTLDWLFGARRNVGNTGFGFELGGDLDHVMIFKRALNASEVSDLYDLNVDSSISGWGFDAGETSVAHDSSGAHDAAVVGAQLQGGYVSFDGSNDHLAVYQPPKLDFRPGFDEFAVSAWFRLASGRDGAIISKATGDGASQHQFQLGYSQYNDGVFVTVGGTRTDGTTAFDDNQWHHVVAVVSANDVDVYVDGEPEIVNGGVGSYASAIDWLIGARRQSGNSGTGFPFWGDLDDVRIFNKTLSDTERYYLLND